MIFVTKCDKGWVGCFLECDITFFKQLNICTVCFIIASLAFFQSKFGFASKSNLAILFLCHFDVKRDTISSLLRKQKNILLKFMM